MFRILAFAFAMTFGVSASPIKSEKEIRPLVAMYTVVSPCPPVLVTLKVDVPKVQTKDKKKKPVKLTAPKQKKKIVALASKTDHHKSKVSHHHKSKAPTKNSHAHGPLHLTGPPGCG